MPWISQRSAATPKRKASVEATADIISAAATKHALSTSLHIIIQTYPPLRYATTTIRASPIKNGQMTKKLRLINADLAHIRY
jgi:hypothetical protein